MATRRTKFDFKEALTIIGVGMASGAVVPVVTAQAENLIPDNPKVAKFIPVALGAFLSQQKDKNLQTAGVAMVGAGAAAVLEELDIDLGLNGAMKRRGELSPAQTRKMIERAKANEVKRLNGIKADELEQVLATKR